GIAAEDVRQNEQEGDRAVGGDTRLRLLLGTVPGAGFQAAGDAGHYVVRRQPDARVRDARCSANQGARTEARVSCSRRFGGGGFGWCVSAPAVVGRRGWSERRNRTGLE